LGSPLASCLAAAVAVHAVRGACTTVLYVFRRLTVRVSEEELRAWKEEAWRARMSLSAWVRARLSGEIPEKERKDEEEREDVS
jgi:hypothetical protein